MNTLTIAGRAFGSRLLVGTGKYRSFPEMARCHQASGAEVVTVAVRRVNLNDRTKESLLDHIDREKFFLLPNTAACYTADEAIRTARLGREVGLSHWVKLEVIGDEKTLFPDNAGLLEDTRRRRGFGDHGHGDEARRPSRPLRVFVWPHGEKTLRIGQQPSCRRCEIVR